MSRGPAPGADLVLDLLRDVAPAPDADASRWGAAAREIADEGLAGVGLTYFQKHGWLDRLPAEAVRILEADLNAVRASQIVLFDRFEKLVPLLHEAGVEFLVHKGGALSPCVYDRLEDRPMVDIDIVFRPSAWATVRDVLLEAGYRLPADARQAFWLENYFNLPVVSPGEPPCSFDLHWSLTQEGRYSIDLEDLFSRSVEYHLGGLTLRRLSNEDLLLSLFLHLTFHYFEARMLWLLDMRRVVERLGIDWDSLLERASSWGLSTVVAFNVAFLDKVLPGTVPAEVSARCRPGALRRALTRPLLSAEPRHLFRDEERRINQFLIGLLAIDRPGEAAGFALDKISRSVRWAGRRPKRR